MVTTARAATQVNPFVKDDAVERWLNAFEVTWDGPVDIKIDAFNMRDSRRNQARAEAIVPEAVDAYQVAMGNGDKFPAVVVWPTANGHVFIDGVNRWTAASKFGATHVKGYVVSSTTPSEVIAAMTMSANVRNGASVDKKWRVIQAAHLVASFGFTIDRACQLQSVRPNDVRNYQKLVEAGDAAARAGISSASWEELAETTRISLYSIGNAIVFREAAIVAIKGQLPAGGPTASYVKTIKEALRESEEAALAVITETSEIMDRAASTARIQGRRRSAAPQLGFLTGVGKIMHTDPEKFNRSFITKEDRELAADRLLQLIRHAANLRTELLGRTRVGNDLVDIATEIEKG